MTDWPAAVISPDGLYRYILTRRWSAEGKTVVFIGLNPSTADDVRDDPTIRRCIGFAKSWGGSTLIMVNLFALRSTDPLALLRASDPVGPQNDSWLRSAVHAADVSIAAWGVHGTLLGRADAVSTAYAGRLHALGLTKT